jgi:predicted nuclease of restriction endonuclease-like (RecB) superfamily
MKKFKLPSNYAHFLEDLKSRIRKAQVKAALAANSEIIRLYWDIGCLIVEKQTKDRWGASVIEKVASDLQAAFPGQEGFSPRNIWRMRAFYLAYIKDVQNASKSGTRSNNQNLPQLVAEIPWGHNCVLLEKIKNSHERFWYASMAVKFGWSRTVLVHQIESGLYERQGKAITNFKKTLPQEQSDLAQQIIKDPYMFDFLTLSPDAQERQLEQSLLDHIQRFMMELGVGFSFVGRQVHLEVDQEDFYIDLLFYHLRLRCFVVVELKTTPFKPEYAGKMGFYLAAIDKQFRHKDDCPSIGIILCKSKTSLMVEYALHELRKPIGVSSYKLTKSLPDKLKGTLPTIQDIEKELQIKGRDAC